MACQSIETELKYVKIVRNFSALNISNKYIICFTSLLLFDLKARTVYLIDSLAYYYLCLINTGSCKPLLNPQNSPSINIYLHKHSSHSNYIGLAMAFVPQIMDPDQTWAHFWPAANKKPHLSSTRLFFDPTQWDFFDLNGEK